MGNVTGYTEISVPDLDDLFYMVEDPGGTPTPRKATSARAFGFSMKQLMQGRLTLAAGYPYYTPQDLTPSATDTTANTVDFAAAHGWVTGTIVTPFATGGGLTQGTRYFIRATDADTVAFYTTLADALADTNKVDLTASVTSLIIACGIQAQSVLWEPYDGDLVSNFDATRWILGRQASALTLALGTLTANGIYDIFMFLNAGVPTLELGPVWTSDTVRGTALASQNGWEMKSGALTRRYLGTIRMATTTEAEDSWMSINVGTVTKRWLWNRYNRLPRWALKVDYAGHVLNNVAAFREWNNTTTNRVEVIRGLPGSCHISVGARFTPAASTSTPRISPNVNGDITNSERWGIVGATSNQPAGGAGDSVGGPIGYMARAGYSYYTLNEVQTTAQNVTFNDGRVLVEDEG